MVKRKHSASLLPKPYIKAFPDQYLVYSFLHEVQKHLHSIHVFSTIFLKSSQYRHIDQDIQAGYRKVAQKIYGMTRRDWVQGYWMITTTAL